MSQDQVVIPKTWRSELPTLCAFIALSIVSYYLTESNQWSLITGDIITLGSKKLTLTLPLFWFLPFGAAATAIYRIYNVRYCMDERGIETKVGILSPWQTVTRIRFEDIRGVEYKQSLLGRALNIGQIDIGTAATSDVEVTLHGVSAPDEIQRHFQRERDARIEFAEKKGTIMSTPPTDAANST